MKRTVLFLSALALAATMNVGGIATGSVEAVSCTPGYSPCIPNRSSDVDCWGGGGNGPRFTRPGVHYTVRGYDRYRLDTNHDHRAC